jgi:hypothetical protein
MHYGGLFVGSPESGARPGRLKRDLNRRGGSIGGTEAHREERVAGWRWGRADRNFASLGDRIKRGTAAQAQVSRSSHGAYEAAGNRTDPLVLLEREAQTRVPELVPIRYGRMLVSPFTFYRGAAKIMAADVASTRGRESPFRAAATRTCRTSGCSRLPTDG